MVLLWPFTMHLFSEFVLETDEKQLYGPNRSVGLAFYLGWGQVPGFEQSEHKSRGDHFSHLSKAFYCKLKEV